MKNLKKKKIFIYEIIFLIIIIIFFLVYFFIFLKPISIEKTNISKYTTSFKGVNVSFAKKLIDKYPNITIVDCRGGCQACLWKNGSPLPYAQWIDSPKLLYNYTNDILVYCEDGLKSVDFCEKLINHVYGNIYYLKGGVIAWLKEK